MSKIIMSGDEAVARGAWEAGVGSFIFMGPTGVGKTELSKAVAEAMMNPP